MGLLARAPAEANRLIGDPAAFFAEMEAARGDAGAKEAVMLEAALFMRERKPEKAVKLLGDVVAKGGDVGTVRDARLALAQIHASAGDYANAIDALRGVSELEGTAAGAATAGAVAGRPRGGAARAPSPSPALMLQRGRRRSALGPGRVK